MSNNLLQGKRGIIFGALDEKSIAWKVAKRCIEEGATITLTNTPAAIRFGQLKEMAASVGAEVIPADATNNEDIANLINQSTEILGGKIDFILHSIGMSINVRKGKSYTETNHNWMQKTFDISAMSFHRIMQYAYNNDSMSEWGSILGLSYIAAQRTFSFYGEMAESKALLESYARSFGYHFGIKNKVRVNTISQSPTMTTAGEGIKGFNNFVEFAAQTSPLGNADADQCADYCVFMFSDLSRMITMQNLFHDGGYSMMGVNPLAIMNE